MEELKKYIGTKEVKARHITLGEFIELKGRDPYENDGKKHDMSEAGYLVEYEDGYQSFSPAKAFVGAYRLYETPLDRVRIEYYNLIEKVRKLRKFLETEKAKSLGQEIQLLLNAQFRSMESYKEYLCGMTNIMEGGNPSRTLEYIKYDFTTAMVLASVGYKVKRICWNDKNYVEEGPEDRRYTVEHIGVIDRLIEKERRGYIMNDGLVVTEYAPTVEDVKSVDWIIASERSIDTHRPCSDCCAAIPEKPVEESSENKTSGSTEKCNGCKESM